MIHRYVLHNGAIQDAAERTLSPGQVGLLSGWGVFSTLKVVEGSLFGFERHWARISRDAAAFRVELPLGAEEIRRDLIRLVEANEAYNCTLRIAIVRNGGGMWAGPSTGRASDVIALTADSKDWGAGVKLAYVEQARHSACSFSGAKILSWAMNLAWLEAAQARGFDEVVLLNERGEVAECTSANIFAAYGGRVVTPPLSSGCLPGVTRDVVLNCLQVDGVEVVEEMLTRERLEAADEVFITSTTRDLLPVLGIEGKRIKEAELARPRLQEAFSAYTKRYIAENPGATPKR